VTRTTTTRLIAEQLPNINSRKITDLALKPKMDPELKRQLKPEKTASSKNNTKED
jgi:hypothetical protein